MRAKRGFLVGLMVLLFCAGAGWAGSKGHAEHKVSLRQVPKAVRLALRQAVPGGRLAEIEKKVTDDGVVYEAEFRRGEQEIDVTVNPAGKIVAREVEAADAEEAQHEGLEGRGHDEDECEHAGLADRRDDRDRDEHREGIRSDDDEEDDDHSVCARDADDDGDAEGKTLDEDDLHETVRAIVKFARSQGAQLVDIERTVVYEIELRVDGKELTLTVSGEGVTLLRGGDHAGHRDGAAGNTEEEDDDGDED